MIAHIFLRGCPSCDGRIKATDDHHECRSCGAVVVLSRSGWRFPLESRLRALPGIAGIGFREVVG